MGKYSPFNSNYISYTIDNESSKIAFFGIESGGRDRDKHASYNLMLPGYGAIAGAFKKSAPRKSEINENSAYYENSFAQGVKYTFDGTRTLDVELYNPKKNDIFSTRFAIKTAPPTIWTKKHPVKLTSKNPLNIAKTRYSLPLIIHFPDFGRIEISSPSSDVYCIEELQMSRDFCGIDLGYLNHSYNHNRMHGLHYGSSFLTFKSSKENKEVKITIKVLEESYPKLKDERDKRLDGLKRNWLNSFALNRNLFDMGDNIYFHGTSHISMHLKADLLQFVDKRDDLYKIIRRAFEGQIERSFKEGQAHDGEVSVSFYKREKEKGFGCAVDSTPSAIISLTGIANWNLPFAKKLLPNAIKAADYLMSRDVDGDGIFESPYPGDYMGQPCEFGQQCNWWDNIAFGHKDIYFNYLCHRALRELCELLHKLNQGELAKKYEEQLSKFDKVFYNTFYNSETKLMAGWISKDGNVHDYGFTFAVSMGINEGLISDEDGRKMIKLLLEIMDKQGYGDLRFGIPGNVFPLAQRDTIDWACMSDWGRYENGGLSGMNGYHFLTSMYKVGLKDEADKIFFTILNTYEKEMTHTGLMPGYCQSVDWRTKEGVRCGYNYLADNYYFLLSEYVGRQKLPHPSLKR